MNGHFQFSDVDMRSNDEWAAPGLYEGLPAEEYHALEGRASSSILRKIVTDTPAHAKAYMEDNSEPTSAMRFGTQMHEAVLQPERFEARYATAEQCHAVTGSGSRCTSPGKVPYRTVGGDLIWYCGRSSHQPDEHSSDPKWYNCDYCGARSGEPCVTNPDDPAVESNTTGPHADRRGKAQVWTVETHLGEIGIDGEADVETIGEDRMEQIETMREALQEHPVAEKVLFELEGLSELSMTFEHEATGVPCKARVDRVVDLPEFGLVAVDYKTTRNANPSAHAFGKSIERRRYDMQGAFYSWALAAVGVPVNAFLIVAQEKEPPYATSVQYLPGDKMDPGDYTEPDLTSAQEDLLWALRQYKQSATSGDWPAYANGIVPAEVPTYADAGTPRDERR